MIVLLVRHGETVDNVASVYAGVRDSQLTNHGVLQADRLGTYLTGRGLKFSHIFSSDLQRARKTAEALSTAQERLFGNQGDSLNVIQDPLLREQDFGFYEGKPFYARDRSSPKSGKDNHRSQHADQPDFQDVESKESMRKRADAFVNDHLNPLLRQERTVKGYNVAIFSHGIILNHLWRSTLSLFGKNAISLAPEISAGKSGSTPLEYLGGWSNTGYLEVEINQTNTNDTEGRVSIASNIPKTEEQFPPEAIDERNLPTFPGLRMKILAVNGTTHLRTLKRARGIGSAVHDEDQKKIDSFFKKPKKR